MNYDGYLVGNWSFSNASGAIIINDSITMRVASAAANNYFTLTIPIHKGDTIRQNGSSTNATFYVRYYKYREL